MTAQRTEELYYNDDIYKMASEPLQPYLESLRNPIEFVYPSTACWRGYCGTWEIKDDKLYLIKLRGFIYERREVDINYVFPGEPIVFANWFSGEIMLPMGNLLHYIHAGYESVYEQDLFLEFESGLLKSSRTVDNFERAKLLIEEEKKHENGWF